MTEDVILILVTLNYIFKIIALNNAEDIYI